MHAAMITAFLEQNREILADTRTQQSRDLQQTIIRLNAQQDACVKQDKQRLHQAVLEATAECNTTVGKSTQNRDSNP